MRHVPLPLGKTWADDSSTTTGEEWYIRFFRRCYDLLASSQQDLYESADPLLEPRMRELRDILTTIRAWHATMEHVGDLTGTRAGERHRQFLSHQLFWDMQSMIEGFIGLVEYREQRWGGCAGVRARSCSQDSLESLFGRLRMACGSGQAVSMIKAVHRLCHERMLAQRHDGPLERQRTLVAPALLLRSRQAALDFLMPSGSSCLPVLKQLGTRCSPAYMPQHYGQSFG